jgi:hypothetical protein
MFENSTDSHASDSGAAWREGRTVLGAQAKPLYSQMALSRKTFGIGHMFKKSFLLRMTDTMTSQNIDLSSWDTLYINKPYVEFLRFILMLRVGKSSVCCFYRYAEQAEQVILCE